MPSAVAAAVALFLAAAPSAPDPDLARGLAQVRAREYDQAVETLEAVVRRVYGRAGARTTLVGAYVGLGVASVGQGQLEGARDWFAEALALDPKLRLGRDQPEDAARVFEEVRAVRARSVAPERAKARRRKVLVALGAAAAVGGATAGAFALAPEARGDVFSGARLAVHDITCPTGITSVEVPFTVFVDMAPSAGAVEVRTGTVSMIPVDALFVRAGTAFPRPGTVGPARLGPGGSTLVAESSFGCSRLGAFSNARVELWKAAVTLVTSAGSYYVQTQDQLRVEYR